MIIQTQKIKCVSEQGFLFGLFILVFYITWNDDNTNGLLISDMLRKIICLSKYFIDSIILYQALILSNHIRSWYCQITVAGAPIHNFITFTTYTIIWLIYAANQLTIYVTHLHNADRNRNRIIKIETHLH